MCASDWSLSEFSKGLEEASRRKREEELSEVEANELMLPEIVEFIEQLSDGDLIDYWNRATRESYNTMIYSKRKIRLWRHIRRVARRNILNRMKC